MKYIISYASGGLGNRLLPLASCMELASKLGRKVGVIWNLTNRCHSRFNALFTNNIETKLCSFKDIPTSSLKIYSNPTWIYDDWVMYKNDELYKLSNNTELINLENLQTIWEDEHDYIIIYHNTTFLNLNNTTKYLNSLCPTQYIQEEVRKFITTNNLNKEVIGIHARSTDFEEKSFEIYEREISCILEKNQNQKLLFCSDNPDWEDLAKKKFMENIIIRNKEYRITKVNENNSWSNNTYTPETCVIDGLIDAYILAETNLTLCNPMSSFAKLAIMLGKQVSRSDYKSLKNES